jgi:hypothetical protein
MAANPQGPLYRNIEFCRNTETLWHKLQSGNWDWLGVHPDRKFVLGSPSASGGLAAGLSIKTVEPGVKEGVHGVRYELWNGMPGLEPAGEWFSTAEEARARYEVLLEEYRNQNPILARVRLFEDRWVAEEEFIANIPPSNYQ